MQLVSLWVKDFKNLKDFTINFENQENLSIIIGNNGSGKSNILEAISAIFAELYGSASHIDNYNLKYKINGHFTEIKKITESVPQRNQIIFIVDGTVYSKKYLTNNSLAPSRIVALYSGEETRLYKRYYEVFTKKYLRDFSKLLSPSNSMIYIDRSYWNIALLALIFSAESGNEDHKNFLENELHIKTIHKIRIYFKTSYFPRIIKNSPLDVFLKTINFDEKRSVDYINNSLFLALNPEYNSRSIDEIFNILLHATLLQRAKVFENIEFTINEDKISLNDLSEGEKKKLLIKAAMDFVANENSLVLFDEPDAHIHIEGKQDIFNLFKEYASFNRSIVITTHSPTLTNCANDKHIIMLNKDETGNCQIIASCRQDYITRLTGGIWSAEERNIFFSSNKPLVLVEGSGDVCYIKSAMNLLNIVLNINILPVGGATNAPSFLDEIGPYVKAKKVIMIFDRDDAGYKGLKEYIKTGTRGREDINVYLKNSIYLLLLPKTSGHTDIDFLIEDYFPRKLKNKIAHQIINQGNGCFNKYPKDLRDKIKNELAKIDYKTKENYEGFRVLLNKIKEIIDEDNIQNLVKIN